MDFYTSDTHYFHTNILKYCQRPFLDVTNWDGLTDQQKADGVREMHETMIRLWNERVTPEDTVYHLGDFGFGPAEGLAKILKRLNGTKYIMKGNHDKGLTTLRSIGFADAFLDGFHYDKSMGMPVYLRHKPNLKYTEFPFVAWDDIHLCGHVHDEWARQENIINVGVDQSWFAPLTLQELLNRPEENNWIGAQK